MNGWIVKLLLMLIEQFFTPEMIEELKIKFVEWLEEKAAETTNKIDDAIVEIVKKVLGV